MKKKNEKENDNQNEETQKKDGQEYEIKTAKEAEKSDADSQAETENTNSEEKQISEIEFLKIYLEQSIAELKKTKKEAEDLKKSRDEINLQNQVLKEKITNLNNEFDNYRRRTASEKEAIYSDAAAKDVSALLPALDSLERAMPYAESNPESFKQGVEMTLKLLADGFKMIGVEEIKALGEQFNPDYHNAVMHYEDDKCDDSTVTDVFQKGYKIGEKVIRHSMVKVAN